MDIWIFVIALASIALSLVGIMVTFINIALPLLFSSRLYERFYRRQKTRKRMIDEIDKKRKDNTSSIHFERFIDYIEKVPFNESKLKIRDCNMLIGLISSGFLILSAIGLVLTPILYYILFNQGKYFTNTQTYVTIYLIFNIITFFTGIILFLFYIIKYWGKLSLIDDLFHLDEYPGKVEAKLYVKRKSNKTQKLITVEYENSEPIYINLRKGEKIESTRATYTGKCTNGFFDNKITKENETYWDPDPNTYLSGTSTGTVQNTDDNSKVESEWNFKPKPPHRAVKGKDYSKSFHGEYIIDVRFYEDPFGISKENRRRIASKEFKAVYIQG